MALSTLDQSKIDRIKQELRWHPEGMTISRLASKMKINRNLLAKYLDSLLISGQVTIQITGTAKVYFLSQRVPVAEVLDFITEAVIVLDKDLQILRVNEPLLMLLQVKRDELIGRKIDSSGNAFLSAIPVINLRNNLRPAADAAFEMQNNLDGKTCMIRVQPLPVVFDNGSNGLVLIFENITAQKEHSPLQGLTGARFQGIIEDHTEFAFRFLPGGTISFADDTFCRYFQKSRDQLLGSSLFSYLIMEEREQVDVRLQRLDREHPACSLEHRVIVPSGPPRWHRWTYTVIYSSDGDRCEYLCVGRDITGRLEVTEKMNRYITDQWFLYRTSHMFVNLSDDADIYDTIASGVREILPESFIIVNTFDSSCCSLTTRCFQGEKEREVFSRFMGRDVIGMTMVAPDSVELGHVYRNLMGGKLVKVPGNLYVMLLGLVPQDVCDRIEAALNIGDMYVIGLVSRNVLYGNVLIFLRKGDVLKHNVIIETFIRQATIGFKLRQTEQILKTQGIEASFGIQPPSDEPDTGISNGTPVLFGPETRHRP